MTVNILWLMIHTLIITCGASQEKQVTHPSQLWQPKDHHASTTQRITLVRTSLIRVVISASSLQKVWELPATHPLEIGSDQILGSAELVRLNPQRLIRNICPSIHLTSWIEPASQLQTLSLNQIVGHQTTQWTHLRASINFSCCLCSNSATVTGRYRLKVSSLGF